MDKEFTRRKLALLLKHLNELRSLIPIGLDEYKANFERRYAVERLIEIVVEYAIDINNYIIETCDALPSQTYYDSFIKLAEWKVIPESLAARLASTTGLRNRLVHNYEKVRHDIVYYSLKPLVRNYQRYGLLVEKYLEKQP